MSDTTENTIKIKVSSWNRVVRERDEAREDATNYYAKIGDLEHELNNMQDQRDLAMKVIARLERERDEARAAIVGWENKWKCAVEMAAQTELERDKMQIALTDTRDSLEAAVEDIADMRKLIKSMKEICGK